MHGDDSLTNRLLSALTPEERSRGVAYGLREPLPAGTLAPIPRAQVVIDRQAYLFFVDREPLANWGHPCRFVFIEVDGGQIRSIDSRLPPFNSENRGRWRVVYRAPGLPDAALAIPE